MREDLKRMDPETRAPALKSKPHRQNRTGTRKRIKKKSGIVEEDETGVAQPRFIAEAIPKEPSTNWLRRARAGVERKEIVTQA